MKLGATLYIKNTTEAVSFYSEAFGLTLGYHEKYHGRSFFSMKLTVLPSGSRNQKE